MNNNIGVISNTISETMSYDGTVVLKYSIAVPQLTTKALGVSKINEFYIAEQKKLQNYCRTEMYSVAVADYNESKQNGYPVHIYEADRSFTVTASDGCVLSLYTDTYQYTGGAHGSMLRTSQSWGIPGGRRITLDSLFPKNPHYRAALIARITAMIAANPDAYFEDYKRLAAESFNPESFYLTPDGFGIYYQQYDIAPYSSGIAVFEFTYENTGAVQPRCVRTTRAAR